MHLYVFPSTNVIYVLGVSLHFGQQVASYQVRSGVILAQRKNRNLVFYMHVNNVNKNRLMETQLLFISLLWCLHTVPC